MLGTLPSGRYKFAHTRLDPDGRRRLLWVPGEEFALDAAPLVGSREAVEALGDARWLTNFLTDEGEASMLNVYYRNTAVPAGFFFRLYNATPTETSTLGTITGEVSGTGYAAITVARDTTDWGAPALDAGDHRIVSTTKTFTAGGTWTAATRLVLATTSDNTGLLVAAVALSATRTLVNGDTLQVSLAVKQS